MDDAAAAFFVVVVGRHQKKTRNGGEVRDHLGVFVALSRSPAAARTLHARPHRADAPDSSRVLQHRATNSLGVNKQRTTTSRVEGGDSPGGFVELCPGRVGAGYWPRRSCSIYFSAAACVPACLLVLVALRGSPSSARSRTHACAAIWFFTELTQLNSVLVKFKHLILVLLRRVGLSWCF